MLFQTASKSPRKHLLSGILWVILIQSFVPVKTVAQQNILEDAVTIYLDCPSCDTDYVKSEIQFVNYALDRSLADVHLLVTSERSGSGGTVFTLDFIGQRVFAGQDQRLSVSSEVNASEDNIREKLTAVIKAGLLRYAIGSSPFSDVTISYSRQEQTTGESAASSDPWNNWVFSIGGNTFLNGQSQYSQQNINGNLSAARVTERWKTRFNASASVNSSKYSIDGGTFTNTRRNRSVGGSSVLGLSDHWSVAVFGDLENSTFSNYDLKAELTPAVEYNVYPYAESTRRAWRFQFRPSLSYSDYNEITIYDKETEWLFENRLSSTVSLQQPWGSVNLTLSGAQYVHDLDRYQASIFGGFDLRLMRGLSLNIFGDYTLIRNQVSLRKGDASNEDILLQIRELSTSYTYFFTAGITYRFGALRNNAVNTRFGNTGGGGYSISISH